MTTMTLYTGAGASYSPLYEEGRTVSEVVRLIADEGKGITDGVITATVIDTNDPERWADCEMPEELEDASVADYEAALNRLGVEV